MRIVRWRPAFGLVLCAAGCVSWPWGTPRPSTGPVAPTPQVNTLEQQTVAAITKMGAKVEFDLQVADKPAIGVDLRGVRITDGLVDSLGQLKKLRKLNLYNTKFTDADLASLAILSSLQTLNLSATRITDSGLASLQTLPNLQVPAPQ